MEQALDKVVKKFDDTEEGLKRIENHLEADITAHLQSHNPDDVEGKESLLLKLDEIKRDYADIKKEALELGQLQREMAIAFQKEFQETVLKLQSLTDKEAASHNSSEAAESAVNSLIEQSNVAEALTNKLKSHQS